jgi:sulfide:quinone oxidoreductase
VPYDAVLLALGARVRPAFRNAVTIDDAHLTAQVETLLGEIDGGRVRSVALVIPWPMPWPLPIYELALMTAKHARDARLSLRVDLVTPEDAPLALFGAEATEAVSEMLAGLGVTVHASAHCGVPDAGRVFIHPGPRMLRVDRVLALPQLFGPPSPGVPGGVHNGFLAVDPFCRVRGVPRVFAAGDATDFPIKHGSIAAQQADTAARSIAALAGADVELCRFDPVLNATLVGGDRPLRVRAQASGLHGVRSEAHEEPLDPSPAAKLTARYLTPYLDAKLGVSGRR